MSQHDGVIDNNSPALVRVDFNNALVALAENNSGATDPAETYPFQWWLDTANNLLKLRNAADNAWVTVGTPSVSNFGLLTLSGGTMAGVLLAAVGDVGAPGVAFSGDADTGFYWVSANTWGLVSNGVEYLRISPTGISLLGTGASTLPSGSTAQRPTPANGMMRYNSDLSIIEAYSNGSWKIVATPAAYPFSTSDFDDVTIVGTAVMNGSDYDLGTSVAKLVPTFPWSAPVKLSDPSSLPAGSGFGSGGPTGVDVSPNGEFVVFSHGASPYIIIYQRQGTEYVKLANPGTIPTDDGNAIAFSPNGQYVALAHNDSPYVSIYKRTGATFTKLSDPATIPTEGADAVCWAPNSEYVAFVCSTTSPRVFIYRRTGDTFTKISNPTALPDADATSCSWSPDGKYLALGSTTAGSDELLILSVSVVVAGVLSDASSGISAQPGASVTDLAWSPNGEFLALSLATSPRVMIYQRSGTTFTKLSDPATLPTGAGDGVAWSPDSKYLCVTHDNSPYLTIYERSGTTFTKLADPATLPTDDANCAAWSKDGQFLYVGNNGTSPRITFYQTASDLPTESLLAMNKKFRAAT